MEVAESGPIKIALWQCLWLQWGRDLEVAESDHDPNVAPRALIASMGPRLGSRGKNRKAVSDVLTDFALQWGRDLEVAERLWTRKLFRGRSGFNGAATWKSRKGHRRDESARCPVSSFNGAATWKSRKDLSSNSSGSRASMCFNGAATWKSRKAGLTDSRGSWTTHASMGPRLGSRGKGQRPKHSPSVD